MRKADVAFRCNHTESREQSQHIFTRPVQPWAAVDPGVWLADSPEDEEPEYAGTHNYSLEPEELPQLIWPEERKGHVDKPK